MSEITAGLLITLIGMGLVFVALLLLWGLMYGMVRITNRFFPDREEPGVGEDTDSGEESPVAAPLTLPEDELRQQAAAAAVAASLSQQPLASAAAAAVAVALSTNSLRNALLPAAQNAPTSSWQAVHRANRLSQRLNLFSRKTQRN